MSLFHLTVGADCKLLQLVNSNSGCPAAQECRKLWLRQVKSNWQCPFSSWATWRIKKGRERKGREEGRIIHHKKDEHLLVGKTHTNYRQTSDSAQISPLLPCMKSCNFPLPALCMWLACTIASRHSVRSWIQGCLKKYGESVSSSEIIVCALVVWMFDQFFHAPIL